MASEESIVARARFSVPRIPNATVPRRALVDRLAAASDSPLSLVVAAPGSGKTSLLAQWVEGRAYPVAWMSCGPTDVGVRFWRDLATAVGLAWDEMASTTAELADHGRSDELAIGIANALGSVARPGAIVVDDLHLADPGPAVMRAFIGALPAHVRLVVGSRRDPPFPLSKLRLQGRLLELRQADLRFTGAEARQVLAGLGVEVTDPQLEQITAVTEGWPAAVHLAGLWLQAHHDPAGLVRGLFETDRSLVDFLMNEVIELQPPEIIEFLTVTSELEVFDAALCDSVRARHDSTEMLRRVREASLFLVEVDRAGSWYRYHHLFAQFLRSRLRVVAPERAPLVHRAAAEAYGNRGDLMAAVQHRLQAGDTDAAMAQLVSYATGTWSLEDQGTGGATARAWIREHGPSHLEHSPQSVLVCTVLLNASGYGDDAEPWLRRADAREPDLDREGRFLLHVAWSFDRLQRGDPAAALDRARRAEAILREGPVHGPWTQALPNLAIQSQLWLAEIDGAEATIDAVRAGPVQPPVVARVRMPGFASQVQVLRGELTEAERLASSALAAADELGLHRGNFGRAEPQLTLAAVALERNRLDEAEVHLEQVLVIAEGGRLPPAEVQAHVQLASVASARGDGPAASEALRQARAVLPHPAPEVLAPVDQLELQVALDRGDPETANALLARLSTSPTSPTSPSSGLLAARVRLAVDDPAGALAILEALPAPGSTRRREVEHGILSALALAGTNPARAHDVLHRALVLAEPVGFRRMFVVGGPVLWQLLESLPAHGRIAGHIAGLLDAAHHVVPATPMAVVQEGLVEPLSERELTVLRYLASRLTSAEIARELYLSANTVRSHVKAIYRKLGVNTRAEAVRVGQALDVSQPPD
jgi:LuxR family maltose regulon positive regulatory protein